MGNSWALCTLEQVCERIKDGAHHSPKSVDEGLPMASVKDLTPYGINLKTCRLISPQDFQKLVAYGCRPEVGDVLIAKDGNSALDTVCEFKTAQEVVLLSSVAILRPDTSKITSAYLRYFLDCETTRQYLKDGFITGAAIPRVIVQDFKRAQIKLPPLPTQRKIAAILSAYDDLIENNTRRIRILEEMAQALYREWFVHLRFPGHDRARMGDSALGMIPENWAVGRLDQALVLQRGFDLPVSQRRPGKVPVYASTGVVGTHDEAKVKAPGLVTGRSGSLGTVLYVDDDFWPLNTTLWVKEFRGATPLYGYFLLKGLGLGSFNSGAAVPTLNRNDIHGLTVLLPAKQILDLFDVHVKTMFGWAKVLREKNANLRCTRDLLLPKLISGELDVTDLDLDVPPQPPVSGGS